MYFSLFGCFLVCFFVIGFCFLVFLVVVNEFAWGMLVLGGGSKCNVGTCGLFTCCGMQFSL